MDILGDLPSFFAAIVYELLSKDGPLPAVTVISLALSYGVSGVEPPYDYV